MKRILIILTILGLTNSVKSQNPNFVPGTHKTYTVAGRSNILAWTPDTTTGKKYPMVVNFTGNNCNDSAAAVGQGFAKRIRLSTSGIHRDSFFVVTIIRKVSENNSVAALPEINSVLDTIYKYCGNWIDTSRSAMTGLSQGQQELYRYLSNFGGTGGKYRTRFKSQVILSGGAFSDADYNGFHVNYTKVCFNTSDPIQGSYWNAHMYDLFLNTYGLPDPLTKKIELAANEHGPTVWDSAASIVGTNANTNTWMWILSPTYGLVNASPIAVAGNTQTFALGTTSTTLNGSSSYDPDGSITSYSWSQLSGAASTIVSASSASTSITGLTTGVYRYVLTVTDNSSATAKDTISVVVIGPRHQLPIAGVNMFRNGGRDGLVPLTRLLNGDTTDNACPLGYATTGIDLPYTGIILLDSTVLNPVIALKNLSGGGGTNLTFWLYNEARTDSISASVSTVTNAWNYVDSNTTKGVHFPVRKIEFRTNVCLAFVSEIRVYGTTQAVGTQIFPSPVTLSPAPFHDFTGVAMNGDEPDSIFNSVGSGRIFIGHWYIDSSATFNPNARNIIFNFFGGNNSNTIMNAYRTRGMKLSYATFGAIRAFHNPVPSSPLSYGSFDDNQKNMATGADSTVPAAWIASAQDGYFIAGWGGRNASVSWGPHTVKTGGGVNVTKANNLLDGIEEGNESNASWSTKRYQDSRVRAAKQSAFYDGHKNTMGSYAGVKNADPTMKVGMGALVGFDSTVMKTDALFFHYYRGFNDQPLDYYCINQYFTYTGEQSFSQPSENGISPGQFDWYNRARKIVSIRDRYMPGVRIRITEFGWDKNGNTAYSALAHGSLDSEVVQANYIHLAYQIGRAVGIDEMDQYRSRDEGVLANNGDFVTSGQTSGYPYTRWAANYWSSTMLNVLTGYDALPTIINNGDSTGLWVFKYQQSGNDTVVYVLQSGTNNDSYFNYNISTGNTSFCQKVTMAKGSKTGVRTTVSPSAGVLGVTGIGETPVYIRYVQAGASPLNNQIKGIKLRRVKVG